MARPKSMPDFAALIDPSSPLPWKEHQRKKPSISLAAGLIMATESPKMGHMTTSPSPLGKVQHGEDWSENLFYAYALKVYGLVPLPSFYRLLRKPRNSS
jgi:hypothetical protein